MIIQWAPVHKEFLNIEEFFDETFTEKSTLNSFSDVNSAFLDELSRRLSTNTSACKNPDLLALSFWLRKSHLEEMIALFKKGISAQSKVVPRGIAFHLAPGRVHMRHHDLLLQVGDLLVAFLE